MNPLLTRIATFLEWRAFKHANCPPTDTSGGAYMAAIGTLLREGGWAPPPFPSLGALLHFTRSVVEADSDAACYFFVAAGTGGDPSVEVVWFEEGAGSVENARYERTSWDWEEHR